MDTKRDNEGYHDDSHPGLKYDNAKNQERSYAWIDQKPTTNAPAPEPDENP